MKYQYYACSDIGKVRRENQDCLIVKEENHLFAVSDGMGGLAYGKETAEMVRDLLFAFCENVELQNKSDEQICDTIFNTIQYNSRLIQEIGNRPYERAQYGATLTGFILIEEKAVVFNVGDSRVYTKKKEEPLIQLTKDQSWIQRLLDDGAITKEEAKTHPMRSGILEFMGKYPSIQPQVLIHEIEEEETLCACSDGLSGMVEDDEIQEILGQDSTAEEMAETLMQRALRAGGRDNISIVIWKREREEHEDHR